MNCYTRKDFVKGINASFEVDVTQEMLDGFTNLTGDVNPMHLNDDFARKYGFDSRLVYGMLSASFYSTLVGVYLPGKYCLLLGVHASFANPVYVGDRLTVSGKVTWTDEERGLAKVKAKIETSRGGVASRATVMVSIREEINCE